MASRPDPQVAAHLEWIGFVRPTGLVVSAPALVKADAILNRRDVEGQQRLNECVTEPQNGVSPHSESYISDFRAFASGVLDWNFSSQGYAGTDDSPIPPELEVSLPDTGDVLRPTFAVRTGRGESTWQLLVHACKPATDLDHVQRTKGGPDLSPHGSMERLLRQTGTPAGLLCNGSTLRLVSAPKGESSGWLDFRVRDMTQTAGRPICAAMRLLLGQHRLLGVGRAKRLAGLLAESRKYQNEVSERLSEQVLHALYELLRGFQAAHDASPEKQLLGRFLNPAHPRDDRGQPDEVYRALLALVLRLIFLLYAEERDMLPQDETFLGAYSIAGLHKRLTADAALHPDTMDQRYGAYAQLLALFSMVHEGAHSGTMELTPRQGTLFSPDRYPFLAGRTNQVAGGRQAGQRVETPLVPDGTVYRVLDKLLVLDGERISYRALDVEHIGSVYETMMGFRLQRAQGPSVAVKAAKKHGAPTTVDLEALLAEAPNKRAKWIRDRTDRNITTSKKTNVAVRAASTLDDLHAALESVVDKHATPDLVHAGAMVLQPSEERRRSGSHYTPRELTEPIVRDTLQPVLARLRDNGQGPPSPDQLLDIKVCDPAMGSGAFLVEACRQLGDALVESWHASGQVPNVTPDETEDLLARRMVAQRCLYGVDRNPVAVDLAKLSLWLMTLARDHPLTFLDHALRYGDSLVGLSQRQIKSFHWKDRAPDFAPGFEAMEAAKHLAEASEKRRRIREAEDDVSDQEKKKLWCEAKSHADDAKFLGDLVVAAFFESVKPREREATRAELAGAVAGGTMRDYTSWRNGWCRKEPPLAPFHWEIEFPEVFDRKNPGFDAIVGNPPFAGKNTVAAANVDHYPLWLKQVHEDSHGNADLVAHFFRRAFDLIRNGGAFGLIATNTIAQGDTRSTGLRWICQHGGSIYQATTRVQWPGLAAVVVSVLHVAKGTLSRRKTLDGREVDQITAFLFHRGGHGDPAWLKGNAGKSFNGSIVLGMGFTFDDTDKKGKATPIAEMTRLIEDNQENQDAIFPYIGGQEVNNSPTHEYHRYVINFGDWPLQRDDIGEAWEDANVHRRKELRRQSVVPNDYPDPVAEDWPDLLDIVRENVKPERDYQNRKALRERWWHYAEKRPGLYSSIMDRQRILTINCGATPHHAFTFLPNRMVFANTLAVFSLDTYAAFCALQSRVHEVWARFFGSTLEDRLRYTPSDVFETFPFPENWQTHPSLEAAGKKYYQFRGDLMVRNNEGLTKAYNRFHDRNENDSEIGQLRDLHDAMDRAVLSAYGWFDIHTDCKFVLDYEIDEQEWGHRRKPYRYRWPNEVRDEVLARLLELNAHRAELEAKRRP